ncbi:MAG: class I SAM-dependent methyltransferase [Tumebacillaceae bacterium]
MTQNSNAIYNRLLGLYQQEEESGGDTESIGYRIVTYIKYDFACPADHAKKIMEKDLVTTYIEQHFDLAAAHTLRTLDIGCATGRYPTWFASLGMEAHGYDIEEGAMQICRERGAKFTNVHFEKRNVLEDEVEPNKFDLITCMMGTFNHIPEAQRVLFFERLHYMLKPGGVALFSSWNPDSPYTNFLQFYKREERELLKKNSISSQEIPPLLGQVGLRTDSIQHFAFHPDTCYEAWSAEMKEEAMIELDQNMRTLLEGHNSQMYLVAAVKDDQVLANGGHE